MSPPVSLAPGGDPGGHAQGPEGDEVEEVRRGRRPGARADSARMAHCKCLREGRPCPCLARSLLFLSARLLPHSGEEQF